MQNSKSISSINWHASDFDESLVRKISKKFKISYHLSQILVLRKIDIQEIDNFLNPRIKNNLPNPSLLSNVSLAADIIYKSIIQKKKITIFGDYDVDGATSSAILKKFFSEINFLVNIYIPDRVTEGYGPSKDAFKRIKDNGCDIIITVDCGATSHDVIKYANEINLDVIVIDHHIGHKVNPDAAAVINPNSYNEIFPYKNLCAAGVVFLFIVELNKKLRDNLFYNNIKEPVIYNYVDLVALGTICDVMKLDHLNRSFVYQGLKLINKKLNIGINSLISKAQITDKITSYHLGYLIGPRINAGGRIGESYLGSKLLSSNCHEESFIIANQLDEYNIERKKIESEATTQAFDLISNHDIYNCEKPIILAYSNNWHEGIIGIVASRVKEFYNKPTIIITFNKDKIGKASCRSIDGIDFGKLIIDGCNNNFLLNGGGHAMAGGFTINYDKLESLYNYWCHKIGGDVAKLTQNITKKYDCAISLDNISLELIHEINKLEPYGVGNPRPKFLIKDVRIVSFKYIGKNSDHVSLILSCKSNFRSISHSAVIFNIKGKPIESLITSSSKNLLIDIIATININIWNNKQNIQIIIDDIIIKFV
jgi:single-stranded-DNA-specific exonuclease